MMSLSHTFLIIKEFNDILYSVIHCVEKKWQIKLFSINWLELWLLKGNLIQEMLNFGGTFRPVWWTCCLKVDIFVSETVCQQQRIGTGRRRKKKSILEDKAIEGTQTGEERRWRAVFSFHTQKIPTVSCIFPICVIHIRDSVIHLCSPFLTAQSWISSIFTPILKGNTEPGMTFDMSMNTGHLIETSFALLSKIMDHYYWETWY